MSERVKKEGRDFFRCEECGFHFESRELAERCEKSCSEQGVCSSEITAESVERSE